MELYNTKNPQIKSEGLHKYLYIDNYEHNRILTTLLERLDELDTLLCRDSFTNMLITVFIIYFFYFGREVGLEPTTTDLKDRSNFSNQHSFEVKF